MGAHREATTRGESRSGGLDEGKLNHRHRMKCSLYIYIYIYIYIYTSLSIYVYIYIYIFYKLTAHELRSRTMIMLGPGCPGQEEVGIHRIEYSHSANSQLANREGSSLSRVPEGSFLRGKQTDNYNKTYNLVKWIVYVLMFVICIIVVSSNTLVDCCC